MELRDCYRVLGLHANATLQEVKTSYRQLARRCHPDLNPGLSPDRFVRLHEAYQQLLCAIPARPRRVRSPQPAPAANAPPKPKPRSPFRHHPELSPLERQLKSEAYYRLQALLTQRRFPHAIALVEGLAQRLAVDLEVRQWQAVTYQRFARHCIELNQLRKARAYLHKALKTDPHNRTLWVEVERDFHQIDRRHRARRAGRSRRA